MITLIVNKRILTSCFVFMLITLTIHVNAQQQLYPASPIRENEDFSSWLDDATKSQLSLVPSLPAKQRDYVRTAFEQRKEFLSSMLDNGQLMFGTELDKKVHQVFTQIVASNPQLKGVAQEYVLMNGSVNALNLGGGCILVFTGLLERLQNEDQLALILCHELAHQYKDHVNKQILKNAEISTDKALNDSIQHILKDQYNTSAKLTNFLIPGLTKKMQYSRQRELEADSLGFIY